MKSFLLNLKTNTPIIKWSMLKNGIFYEGKVPDGYALAVCPSENIVILDVDNKNNKNGFLNIPADIFNELIETFYYSTKSGGAHFWIDYTGNEILLNTSTKYGLDLRIGAKPGNSGGYVKYWHNVDIRQCVHLIKPSSEQLNAWLEGLFMGVQYGKT